MITALIIIFSIMYAVLVIDQWKMGKVLFFDAFVVPTISYLVFLLVLGFIIVVLYVTIYFGWR